MDMRPVIAIEPEPDAEYAAAVEAGGGTVGALGGSLGRATVAIVGAGGIGRTLIALLEPFRMRVLAVTRSGEPVPGAERTVPAERVDEVLGEADHVVLAAPGTPGARRLIDAQRLARMNPDAWLVNVGRGSRWGT